MRKEGIRHSSPDLTLTVVSVLSSWKHDLDVKDAPLLSARVHLCVSFRSLDGGSKPIGFVFRSDSEY